LTIIRLLRQQDTVLTLNIKCSGLGPKKTHKGCGANKTLNEQKAERVVGYVEMADAVLD